MDYDVFISHGADDRGMAEIIARSLNAEGIKATRTKGDLLRSRILLILVTASVFGEEASTIERQVERFQKTRNPAREILCLRVEDAAVWDGIEQFPELNWSPAKPDAHRLLMDACRPKDRADPLNLPDATPTPTAETLPTAARHAELADEPKK